MAARVTEVRDAVKGAVEAWWQPSAADEVLTAWRADLDVKGWRGRKVYVFPAEYATENVTRADEQGDYTLSVLVAERCPDAGDPLDAWLDDRAAWVESLYEMLSAPALRLLPTPGEPYSGLWCERAAVVSVYDLEMLTQAKMFMSEIAVTYREHR